MTVAVICVALLGVLVFGLGVAVSLTRSSTRQGIGHSPDPTDRLHKMVRAHGNTTEYAAMFSVFFLYLGANDPALWVLWVIGVATACRYLQVLGLLASPTLERPHPLRYLGSLGTYVTGLVLCVAVLMTV